MELLERDGALAALAEAREAAARGEGGSSSSPASRGSARPRSSRGSCEDLERRCAGAARHVRRPLDPAAARPDPRPRRERLGGARGGARRRRRAARDPEPADRGAGAAAAADGARARGRALGRRCDARRDHRARAADRRAAGAARPHLPRRRGAAGPSAARDRRRDPCRRLGVARARAAVASERSPRSPATTRTRCTPRPAATRSTSPSCWPRGPADDLPPSVANAVLGRASRLDAAARRLVELVSVVPNRVRTSLLDAVMPDWAAAAEEPERRQLLEVDAAYVRFRHELARNAIRSSIPIAARRRLHAEILEALLAADADPADIVHHAEAAGAEDVVAEYALVAARRAAALESNREAYSHYRRASDFVDRLPAPEQAAVLEELATRGVRSSAGSRTPSPRSSARSRSTASSATRRPWAAARGSCRDSTGSRATATPRAASGARGGRDPRAARRVGRAGPRLQRRSRSSRCSRRTSSRRSRGASGRSSSRPGSATSSTRAHALVNIGSRARCSSIDRDDRDAARGARGRRRRRRPARGDARARQPRATRSCAGCEPDAALRYARAGARLRRRSTRCTPSPRTSPR